MLDLSGREAVVTGGTGALGRAVVGRLVGAGATVHVPVYAAEELVGFPYRESLAKTNALSARRPTRHND